MSGLGDFGEFFFGGWPGGPYRLGSLKWAAMTFAVLFGLGFFIGILVAPPGPSLIARLSDIAQFSALCSGVVTSIVWINALYLRHRKRAPLSKQHRLRQPHSKG